MWLACVDGEVLDASEARIPATDDGLLRGDGVFEVLRLYGGRPYALGEHLERLAGSAARLRLEIDVEAVRADAEALLAAVPDRDALEAKLRVVLTRGGRRVLLVEPLPDLAPSISLALVEYAPPRILDGVKSISYAPNMLATRLAKERGADDALLVTPHGRMLEGATSSFFYVLEGELCTPPLSDHLLDSITRRRVVEVAGARERPASSDELRAMDEAFLASTLREVQPVHAIGDVRLPGVDGAVAAEAARGLREVIAVALAVA